jgi:DNA-binding GntR family transcriptional regulator
MSTIRQPSLPWDQTETRQAASLRIAAAAARAIVTREQAYAPGSVLIEADLAAAAGVSRTPAREAMLLLEAWGLVRLVPKKGAIVTVVTPEERRDLLDIRMLFEIAAVERMPRGADDLAALSDALGQWIERQRTALADGDLLAFASADYAFHAQIILLSGNQVVSDLLATLGPRITRLTHLAVTDAPERVPTFLNEHEELAACARQGDSARYTALIRQHIGYGHFSPGAGART